MSEKNDGQNSNKGYHEGPSDSLEKQLNTQQGKKNKQDETVQNQRHSTFSQIKQFITGDSIFNTETNHTSADNHASDIDQSLKKDPAFSLTGKRQRKDASKLKSAKRPSPEQIAQEKERRLRLEEADLAAVNKKVESPQENLRGEASDLAIHPEEDKPRLSEPSQKSSQDIEITKNTVNTSTKHGPLADESLLDNEASQPGQTSTSSDNTLETDETMENNDKLSSPPIIVDDEVKQKNATDTEEAANQPTPKPGLRHNSDEELNHSSDSNADLVVVPPMTSQRSRTRHRKGRNHNNKKASMQETRQEPRTLKEKLIFAFNIAFNVVSKLFLWLILALILAGIFAGGAGIGYFAHLVKDTEPPSKEEMTTKLNQYDQQSVLFYGDGNPIAKIQTDVVRNVTTLDQVSPYIIDGFIATEDEYFYEHPGIVPKAILRAGLETLFTGSGTGGSTITQQLVKQQLLTDDVTFFRKANEILLALRVDKYFSKDEILTSYLNISPFGRNNSGENIAGINAAAEGIFGVSAKDVNLNQAAFLAGLPQDPYSYTPYEQTGQVRPDLEAGVNRMKEVLYRMYRAKKIDKTEYEDALTYDITKDFTPGKPTTVARQSYLYQAVMNAAIERLMLINIEKDGASWKQVWADVDWYNEYYFAAEQELKTSGYKVYSTIDKEIYDQLQVSAKEYEDQLGATYDGVYTDPETGENTYYVEKVQTGMVVIDNASGKVLGFVAGTDYDNNQIDHAFKMRRSPGSTIKPLAVYGPAIENNIITPSSIIPDTAFVQTFEDGSTWAPTNYGNTISNNYLTARVALYRSDNLPAVKIYKTMQDKGINIIDYLEKMGFNTVDSYTEEDTGNLAFAIGGVTTGPTVFEETRAFTTFANGGYYRNGHLIEKIEDGAGNVLFEENAEPVKVFNEDSNYLMIDMLRDTFTEGTGRTANANKTVPGDWIAKSGISENSKDVWFLASTPSITIGSWIGYDSRYAQYTIDINDGFDRESVRSQIYWAKIVNDLYAIRPEIFGTDRTFDQPSSVVKAKILEQTGTQPGIAQVSGYQIQMTGPLREDLFKASKGAPKLDMNFMIGATDDEVAHFWNSIISAQQAAQRQREGQDTEQTESTSETESTGDESQTSEETDSSETDTTDTDTP